MAQVFWPYSKKNFRHNDFSKFMTKELFKFLWPYVRSEKKKVFGTIFFSFVLAGIKFAQAYLVKPVFDNGLGQNASFHDAVKLAAFLLILGIINFPCRFYHFYWIRYVVDLSTNNLRTELFSKLQRLPISFFATSKQGEIISTLTNDTHVFSGGFKSAVDLIREPLTAFFMLALAFYRDPALTVVILLVAPLFIWIFGKSGKKIRKSQGEVQLELASITHNLSEGISGQKIIKAFNLEKFVLNRFHRAQGKYFLAQMDTTFIEEFAHPLVELVGAVAFSGVIIFAHSRIQSGAITTGDFVSFITALALLMDPIRKYSQANVKLNQSIAAYQRLVAVLRIPEEKNIGEHEIIHFNDNIKLKNVSFSYGHGDVLKNLNLEIKKGQKVAFVGLSGSGKSTLINILLGLYPLDRGSIEVDGVSLDKITLQSLRRIFGLVSQDIFLFHDTIKENLYLGQTENEANFKKALEVSYSQEFISKLPLQNETVIGDRGMRLSGGQQQRLTIARAFLHNPDIFLFDEATSALDNESEKIVQAALDNVSGNKTVISVAHRLSTIQNYHQIFVMKEGLLIERGTHRELMDQNGEYAKLYALSLKAN